MVTSIKPQVLTAIIALAVIAYALQSNEVVIGCVTGITALGMKLLEKD